MLAWITAFLCERYQFVRIGTHSSTLQYINGGVWQGTKLGPLLFAVKGNEYKVPRAKFVDDLTVLGILPRNSPSVMNNIVADIQSFTLMNNIELNPDKGKYMIVDFLQFNTGVLEPIVIGGMHVCRNCIIIFNYLV